MDWHQQLSRRERQIMDVIFARGAASAKEVWEQMPDPPSPTAVRTMLRILEAKGYLKHKTQGRQFIYLPKASRKNAGQTALRRVLATFFGGSLEQALAAHLTDPVAEIDETELRRVVELIAHKRQAEKASPEDKEQAS